MDFQFWLPADPTHRQPEPPRRTRKTHRKSRNGCQMCKSRRVRCDERRPMCTNCLTRGNPCVYSHASGSADRLIPEPSPVSGSPLDVLGASAVDPFRSMEIDMPYRSQELLHHFIQHRNDLRRIVLASLGDQDEPILPVKFVVNPPYKRSLLLMAAKHRYGLTGQCDWSRDPTYLYHKTEVIRELKDQIRISPDNPGDWSFSVIFYLVLMESLDRDRQTAEAHLKGLTTLLRTVQPRDHSLYLSGHTLLSLGLLFLSLIEGAKKPPSNTDANPSQWQRPTSPFTLTHNWEWCNVAYLLSHMVEEFLVRDDRLIATLPAREKDVVCLQWMIKTMRRMREQTRNPVETGSPSSQAYQDPQRKIWVVASACYALVLITLCREHGEAVAHEDEEAEKKLVEVRGWWDDKLAAWTESQSLPDCGLVTEVLEKLGWLTTLEGETAVQQLHRGCVGKMHVEEK